MKRIVQIFLLPLLVLPLNSFATSLLPLDISSLHQQSQDILVAESVSNSTKKETASGLIVTYSSFKVLNTLKGAAVQTYTIKQIGGKLPGDSGGLKVPGVPTFTVGERYVLFVPPASKTGFASPVGLMQGKFDITSDANTNTAMVSNGRDFGVLTQSLPSGTMPASVRNTIQTLPAASSANLAKRTKIPLHEFELLIRSLK